MRKFITFVAWALLLMGCSALEKGSGESQFIAFELVFPDNAFVANMYGLAVKVNNFSRQEDNQSKRFLDCSNLSKPGNVPSHCASTGMPHYENHEFKLPLESNVLKIKSITVRPDDNFSITVIAESSDCLYSLHHGNYVAARALIRLQMQKVIKGQGLCRVYP